MSDKKLPPPNRTRPPKPDEWPYIWDGSEKGHKTWSVGGAAIYAAVTNWKAWIVIGGVVAFIKGDDIVVLIQSLIGGLG